MTYIDPDVEDFLEHFGIKGQKWGVRRERKLQERTEKREGKAQKYVARANEAQKQIDALNSNKPKTMIGRARQERQKHELMDEKTTALKDADLKRQGKLSTGQKKAVKGAVAAAAIIVAVGSYRMAQSGEFNRIATKGKNFVHGKPSDLPWKKASHLATPDMTEEAIFASVVKPINPDFGGLGTKQNCRRATFAYELRRRGYDVQATKTTNARGQSFGGLINATRPGEKDLVGHGPLGLTAHAMKEQLKGKAHTPVTDVIKGNASQLGHNPISFHDDPPSHAIFKALRQHPDGARGELTMAWRGGGAHSVAWEKVKGKLVVFDTQSGKMFRDDIDLTSNLPSIHSAAFTRLDNMPLNTDFLQRWLK